MIGDPLQDNGALGDHLAVVQLECRHGTLRRDLEIVALYGRLRFEVDLDEIECLPGFSQGNLRSKSAGTDGIVQFHIHSMA